jgi:RNA polymerase sigma factor (sigma-70 family)
MSTRTEPIAGLILQRKQFLRFVEKRVDSASIAEDILQSAYARAIEQVSTLRDRESAAAWFYRVLRNAVIDYYRHRSAEDRALERWAQDLGEMITDPSTEQVVCECIEEILPTLKPSYREILHEVDLADESLEVFARKTGITVGNAAVRIHRARQALKRQLLLICSLCARHGCVDCTCS